MNVNIKMSLGSDRYSTGSTDKLWKSIDNTSKFSDHLLIVVLSVWLSH